MFGRYIDTGSPIAKHPLNNSLEMGWILLSGRAIQTSTSDLTVYDLTRRFKANPYGPEQAFYDPNGYGATSHNGGGISGVYNTLLSDSEVALNFQNTFSVGCWFRQDAAGSGTLSLSGLVSKYQTAVSYTLRLENQTCEIAGNTRVMGGTTTLGQWQLLLASIDSSGAATLYLDGASVATGSPAIDSNTTDAVRLGLDYAADTNYRGFNGLIGGAWIWSRPLTQNEVREWLFQCRNGFPDVLSRWSPSLKRVNSAAAPTRTGTFAVSVGAATGSYSAEFDAPIYSATFTVSIAPVDADYTATFSPGTKTATFAVTVGPTDADYTATFSPGTKTATFAVSTAPVDGDYTATFTAPVYTGTFAVTVGPTDGDYVADVTNPTYSAEFAVTIGPVDGDYTALFATAVYSATFAVITAPVDGDYTATFVAPVYTGTFAVSVGHVDGDWTATFTAPVYSATFAVSTGHVDGDYTATFVSPDRNATFAVTVGPTTAQYVADFSPTFVTATFAVTIGEVTASYTSTFYTILSGPGFGTLTLVQCADGTLTVIPSGYGTATLQ